jgi:hypothetical protein
MNDTTKTRKSIGPIELYAKDGDTLTRIEPQPPQNLRSSDALKRWLKNEAQLSGEFVFMRKLVGLALKREQVEHVTIVEV